VPFSLKRLPFSSSFLKNDKKNMWRYNTLFYLGVKLGLSVWGKGVYRLRLSEMEKNNKISFKKPEGKRPETCK
jgi:hypothetical protein